MASPSAAAYLKEYADEQVGLIALADVPDTRPDELFAILQSGTAGAAAKQDIEADETTLGVLRELIDLTNAAPAET